MSCTFSGNKALDLCNGGMVWSCCIPKAKFQGGRDSNGGGSEVPLLAGSYDGDAPIEEEVVEYDSGSMFLLVVLGGRKIPVQEMVLT